jgi:hypothetical protein
LVACSSAQRHPDLAATDNNLQNGEDPDDSIQTDGRLLLPDVRDLAPALSISESWLHIDVSRGAIELDRQAMYRRLPKELRRGGVRERVTVLRGWPPHAADGTDAAEITALTRLLKSVANIELEFQKHSGVEALDLAVNLRVDRRIPWGLVKQVVTSCVYAGFGRFDLAVLRAGREEVLTTHLPRAHDLDASSHGPARTGFDVILVGLPGFTLADPDHTLRVLLKNGRFDYMGFAHQLGAVRPPQAQRPAVMVIPADVITYEVLVSTISAALRGGGYHSVLMGGF